ncbi:amino acid permease [Halorussus sp. MSC15.2]|uniref:amino acid permease n=1 Tax=Halorussus sp. MSC15.2 TaxID=2283638 RepID=UPI0013D8D9E0|nr:amino acid permease [Halorussus sp. MSC15.2]NEU58995.1 amino acid permease [Halorussus sp. MSC15.2]
MAKELERDLGLYATVTISMGAMIGSGIFVLPGLATKIAGPAAILAYLLAGLVVLPAALAKAEMATAMPEAGGTYLYIDRAMGPLPGTIAGVGAWFSLTFKSAFALVGLGAYLLLFVPVPPGAVTVVGLALAVVLLVVNVAGVKQTGRLQAAIVTLVLAALVVFIADGITYVDRSQYHPFFEHGGGGLLAATGFVFVSYAGVTKIASVAEEVEDPGRNIPISILVSVAVMMLVYTFVLFVVVGVVPHEGLKTTLTPMAVAAEEFLGGWGRTAIGVVAVLALTSMANAGVLSSARFPLAMSRDDLAPPRLGRVHGGFKTPVYSIAFTGVVLLALIAFVPVLELAKLASAFKILVFSLVNVALMAFRESDLESYDPEFVAPGYPWVQLFGLVAGLVLVTQMGALPLAGAVGLLVTGTGWYYVYGRERTEREGAALDAIRRTTGDYSLDTARAMLATGGGGGVLVGVDPETEASTYRTLVGVAQAVVTRRGGRIDVVRFESVPEQVTLSAAATTDDGSEAELASHVGRLDAPVETETVVTHDAEHAVANYVRDREMNLLVGEWRPEVLGAEFVGHDADWFLEHVGADVVFVRDRGFDSIDEVTVIADRGPYDPLEVLVADAVAHARDARLRFVYAADEDARDEQLAPILTYHEDLTELCTAPAEFELLRDSDREAVLLSATAGTDLAVAGVSAQNPLYDAVFGTLPETLADELDCTVLLVHSHQPRRHTFLRYLLERLAF